MCHAISTRSSRLRFGPEPRKKNHVLSHVARKASFAMQSGLLGAIVAFTLLPCQKNILFTHDTPRVLGFFFCLSRFLRTCRWKAFVGQAKLKRHHAAARLQALARAKEAKKTVAGLRRERWARTMIGRQARKNSNHTAAQYSTNMYGALFLCQYRPVKKVQTSWSNPARGADRNRPFTSPAGAPPFLAIVGAP